MCHMAQVALLQHLCSVPKLVSAALQPSIDPFCAKPHCTAATDPGAPEAPGADLAADGGFADVGKGGCFAAGEPGADVD